ncbi:MAG: hypothetical protein Q9227_002358 [Pyrenula ochraceoflavens]
MGDLRPASLDTGARRDDSELLRSDAPPRDVTVLVTGFGGFKTYATNPSWLIARQLERVLPPIIDPNNPSRPVGPTIHLLVYPEAVRVSYPTVFSIIPKILSDMPSPVDYILNIGQAAGRKYYSVESLAHRDGYKIRDVDGNLPTVEEKYWKNEARLPEILRPDLDTEEIFARWKTNVDGEVDVRLSTDAGHYLCDFIFYTSLATKQSRTEEKKALFLHVPGGTDRASIDKGALAATSLIRAMVGDGSVTEHNTEITYAEDDANGIMSPS